MKWGTHFFKRGVIVNPLIRDVMDFVKREDFLPAEKRYLADEDHPIDIGYGQTNSQPYTVAFMLNLLDPQPGQKILDIGSGSGWTSAILAWVVSSGSSLRGLAKPASPNASQGGQSPFLASERDRHVSATSTRDDICGGKVYAIDRIPELVKFGEENARKYDFVGSEVLTFIHSDGSLGLREFAPFDRILASAAFQEFPTQLVDQLARGGIFVAPVGGQTNDIVKVVKDNKGRVSKEIFPGFVFVPMIGDNKNGS